MSDAFGDATKNVIPIWGLMPDECQKIIAQAQKFIRQGWASDVGEVRSGTSICVYNCHGAPYTIGREQRILHLLGPAGDTIVISKNLDAIIYALNSSLQRYK